MARTATEAHVTQTRNHVSKALKGYLKKHDLTVREFNENVLKVGPRNVTAYNWLAGRGLPSKAFIPVLARILGKPHAFFEARTAKPEAPKQSNGAPEAPPQEFIEGVVAGVVAQSRAESPVVHARNPRVIARERARGITPPPVVGVADVLNGSAKNSLTYWSNGDGSATVTMLYNAPRELAQKVFVALAELGVDAQIKDET